MTETVLDRPTASKPALEGPHRLTASQEAARRRTFAIISHPDAGKTTLTEKLLLYGGAVSLAGSVTARKHQRHIQIKEVKFRPKIDEHDFAFKRRNVERFLNDGNKVKSLVIFRGREIVHSEIGREILNRLAAELGDNVLIESPPRQEGNTMVQILAPRKEAPAKPKAAKPAEGPRKAPAGDGKKAVAKSK